ncbi:hypothetical protein AVEN_209048-1 [Araneus ventricosus]|uniref:Uncharacterized protein n=1 Tax=Araneus ventricosus TaxID=182803 RepID=A0A4Y2KIM6_ARAVE|nr:hypothetical protein AVEN_209048-1 [Araneus ventricosus]
MAVNVTRVKGGQTALVHPSLERCREICKATRVKGGQTALVHPSLERCREICKATRLRNGTTGRNSTDHIPQVRISSDQRFCQATRHGNKA